MRVTRHTMEGTPDAVLRRLERAAVSDKAAERAARRGSTGCAVTALGFLLLLFGWVIVGTMYPGWERWVGRVLVVFTAVGAVVSAAFMIRGAGRDLDDRKVAALLHLVRTLRADLPSTAPIRLEADFRPYRKGRLVRRDGGRIFWRRRALVYEHAWLELRARLADGSVLRLRLTDHVKVKERAKRKWVKARERLTCEIALALRLGRAYGEAAAGAAARLEGAARPAGIRPLALRGEGRMLRARFQGQTTSRQNSRAGFTGSLGSPLDGRDLLSALRWTYRGLAPAR